MRFLREAYDKGLIKTVFVATVTDDGLRENAKKALEYIKNKVEEIRRKIEH